MEPPAPRRLLPGAAGSQEPPETLAAASRGSSPAAGTSPRATGRRERRIAGKQSPCSPRQGRGSRAQPHRPAGRPRCVLRPPGHRRHLPSPAPSRHGPGFLLGHFLAQAGGGPGRAGPGGRAAAAPPPASAGAWRAERRVRPAAPREPPELPPETLPGTAAAFPTTPRGGSRAALTPLPRSPAGLPRRFTGDNGVNSALPSGPGQAATE